MEARDEVVHGLHQLGDAGAVPGDGGDVRRVHGPRRRAAVGARGAGRGGGAGADQLHLVDRAAWPGGARRRGFGGHAATSQPRLTWQKTRERGRPNSSSSSATTWATATSSRTAGRSRRRPL